MCLSLPPSSHPPPFYFHTKLTKTLQNQLEIFTVDLVPLTPPRQVLTGLTVTQTTLSNHHHNTALTHFLTGVNQPTRCPCSHFGDLGCWEDEDGTCDLGLATMTAGISKKPQPVLLCVCVCVRVRVFLYSMFRAVFCLLGKNRRQNLN